MSKKVYEMVTDVIIEKLKEGTIPWRKPFVNGVAVNWKTQKEYRGINIMLLEPGEYATFKQIKEAGGKVKKGEKSSIVVFWKMLDIEDEKTGEKERVPLLRYYRVFKIGEQTEGIEPKRKQQYYKHNEIEKAKEIIENYIGKPTIGHKNNGAYYQPFHDHVNVPPKSSFPKLHDFYNVLFHELIHSTGHASRLNREGITNFDKFGSNRYSKEELVAEVGATMLSSIVGIERQTIDNSASYINSWLRALENDKTLIVKASQQAQKACDYIQGISYEKKAVS